jgi:hypothetical protein
MKLLELRRRIGFDKDAPDHVRLTQPELNGGKVSRQQIEALEYPATARTLTISGLDQDTFELLIRLHGRQFIGINFWKCPRVRDLSPLEDAPALTVLNYYWNQKCTRLWNFGRTPALRGMRLDDFSKLAGLDDLASAEHLQELEFGNAIFNKCEIPTLEPLVHLESLTDLSFNAKRIGDERIEPLAALGQLHSLGFPTNLFTTAQVAWLRARLPASVECRALTASIPVERPFTSRGKRLDTVVIGARKPMLDSTLDARRLQRYQQAFALMLDFFQSHPGASPGDYPTSD